MTITMTVRVDVYGDRRLEITDSEIKLETGNGCSCEICDGEWFHLSQALKKRGIEYLSEYRHEALFLKRGDQVEKTGKERSWIVLPLPDHLVHNPKAVLRHLKKILNLRYFEALPLSPLATWRWLKHPNRRQTMDDYYRNEALSQLYRAVGVLTVIGLVVFAAIRIFNGCS